MGHSMKHGMSGTRIYMSWMEMKRRCLLPTNAGYHYYGGRGIKVCDRWLEFAAFYEDMGPRPLGMTLDRIDSDGDYCKENCRWATIREQSVNKRRSIHVEYGGAEPKRSHQQCERSALRLCASFVTSIAGVHRRTMILRTDAMPMMLIATSLWHGMTPSQQSSNWSSHDHRPQVT